MGERLREHFWNMDRSTAHSEKGRACYGASTDSGSFLTQAPQGAGFS